jgi:hypothetical protein
MDAAASKLKGAMVKMHADEAGVVNEKLVGLRFDMGKHDTQIVRAVEACAANTKDIETIRITAGHDHTAHTQRMDVITTRSMEDSKDTALNKTAIIELDKDLRRIEDELISRTSAGLNAQQESLICEVGKLNGALREVSTREDKLFQAFHASLDERKSEVEKLTGAIEKTSDDQHGTLTSEVGNLNGALDNLSAQQTELLQAFHNSLDNSRGEMKKLTGSLEKTSHDQDALHSYVHGALADRLRDMELATDRVKSLVEESREPTVVAGNAIPTCPSDGDDACGTASNLTDTCKRLDNIEKCLDDGSANEAIARVDVAERRLVVLQNMQDDDRMRSKEAVQRLENFVTSVG